MRAGTFLKATSSLRGDFFEDALVFIAEVKADGVLGFVVNRKFPRPLNELEEFRNSVPFELYDGGPVDREHIFMLHRRPDLISGGAPVADGIYYAGDFGAAVSHINSAAIIGSDIKLFIGYCGWDAGELEAEMAEGSWELSEGDVFKS